MRKTVMFQVVVFDRGYGPGCFVIPAGDAANPEPLAADSNPQRIGEIVARIVSEQMRDFQKPSDTQPS